MLEARAILLTAAMNPSSVDIGSSAATNNPLADESKAHLHVQPEQLGLSGFPLSEELSAEVEQGWRNLALLISHQAHLQHGCHELGWMPEP